MIGDKDDLQITKIADASYKTDEKAIGSLLLLLINK